MKLDIAEILRDVKMLVGLVTGISQAVVCCPPLFSFPFFASHFLSFALSLSSLCLFLCNFMIAFVLTFALPLALTHAHSLSRRYISFVDIDVALTLKSNSQVVSKNI